MSFRDLGDLLRRIWGKQADKYAVMIGTGLHGEALREYQKFFGTLRVYRQTLSRAMTNAIAKDQAIPEKGFFVPGYKGRLLKVEIHPTFDKGYFSGYLNVAVTCEDPKLFKAVLAGLAERGGVELTSLNLSFTRQIPAGPQLFVNNYRKWFPQHFG